jgi:hypothetical protein
VKVILKVLSEATVPEPRVTSPVSRSPSSSVSRNRVAVPPLEKALPLAVTELSRLPEEELRLMVRAMMKLALPVAAAASGAELDIVTVLVPGEVGFLIPATELMVMLWPSAASIFTGSVTVTVRSEVFTMGSIVGAVGVPGVTTGVVVDRSVSAEVTVTRLFSMVDGRTTPEGKVTVMVPTLAVN